MIKLTTVENTEYGVKKINLALAIELEPNSWEYKQLDTHIIVTGLDWFTRNALGKALAKTQYDHFKTAIELRENVKIEGVM
jgi:hypothetical protein